jgi:multiple sugar transport system permease protein
MSRFSEKNTDIFNFMDLKRPLGKIGYWVMFAFLILVAMICFLPPLWVIISSFKSPEELMKVPSTLLPSHFRLSKITEIWNKLGYMKYYANTLFLAAGSVFFAVVVNGLTGYVLSCLKPKGSHLIFSLIVWTMLMPNTLSMAPLFKNMVNFPIFHFNLTNTFWPMWICSGAGAFNILLFKNSFDSLPDSLIEAAHLDGCGNIGIFRRIVLPLSIPIIVVVCIFTVNATWGDFLLPYLVLTDPLKYTVMVHVYTAKDSMALDVQLMSLVFTIIPPIILFFVFQRYIIAGAMMGGIKE